MKQTQGRRLIAALRRLRDDEQVIKSKDARGLVRWRVVKRLR